MLPFQFSVTIVVMSLIVGSKCFEIREDNDLCIIRFYERQYFNGAYWTLDSTGGWTNSRTTSRVKLPYHNFHVKSIRSFCSKLCSWQICPALRRRKYSRWSRKKHCKILHGDQSLETLRHWGITNSWILGGVRRIKSIESPNDIDYENFTVSSKATTSSLKTTPSANEDAIDWNTSSTEYLSSSSTILSISGNIQVSKH